MNGLLKVGDNLDRILVVSKKVTRTFSGGEFLLFQFSDKDIILKGIWWDPPRDAIDGVRAGDVVRVEGTVQDYKGDLQVKVSDIEVLDRKQYDASLFLPSTKRNTEEMYSKLLDIISRFQDEYLGRLLQTVFQDESFRNRLASAPAAKGWHHSYLGGLLEHIYDMSRLALEAAKVYPEVDGDLLMAGVLLHDVGKLQELSVTNHFEYSDRGRLLGHITLGMEFVSDYIRGIDGFPDDLEMKIKHMILSHHGQLEHGSPVLPMTVEALLLSYIDNMDAQVRGTLQVIERTDSTEGNWTEYVRLLDRFFYSGSKGDE